MERLDQLGILLASQPCAACDAGETGFLVERCQTKILTSEISQTCCRMTRPSNDAVWSGVINRIGVDLWGAKLSSPPS